MKLTKRAGKIVIPRGWRKLKFKEEIQTGDMLVGETEWVFTAIAGCRKFYGTYIRRITPRRKK